MCTSTSYLYVIFTLVNHVCVVKKDWAHKWAWQLKRNETASIRYYVI